MRPGPLRRPYPAPLAFGGSFLRGQPLSDVLAAVDRLEPAAGLRFPFRVDRELPGDALEVRLELLRPPPQVLRRRPQECAQGDGLVAQRRLGRDLGESRLV